MLTLLALTLLYFLPTIAAAHRGHRHTGFIFLLNFFFGWTGIGWLFLFAWSLVSQPRYALYPRAGYRNVSPGQDNQLIQLYPAQWMRRY